MPYAKITIGGQLAGAQRWSVGISLAPQGAGEPSMSPAQAGAFATQLFTDFNTTAWSTTTTGATALKDLLGTQGTLDKVRFYLYGNQSQAQIIGESTNTAVAGTGSVKCPPQIALVATLLTGLAGASYRGRIYLPCLTYSADGSGNIATGIPALVATSLANFFSVVRTRTAGGANWIPAVSGAAGSNPVSAVRVDNVLDTQRRRRDKIVPTARGAANVIVG